MEELYHLIDHP